MWKMLVYFVAIWNKVWPFGKCCGHLVYFVAIWYILWPFGIFCGHLLYFIFLVYFPQFGMLYQEKSGNPAVILMVALSQHRMQRTK
jgi:hypothetical protein